MGSRTKKPRIMIDDMYDDLSAPPKKRQHPKKPKGSRKPKRLTRKPIPGSLASYAEDYRAAGFTRPQATEMARLAYGQQTIRNRLDAMEAIGLALTLGAVVIDDQFHKLSCSKREDRKLKCNCGA